MKLDLPGVATEFAEAADRALSALGDVDCARRAEADPGLRSSVVAPALGALGLHDLDPRYDLDTACAAAELCRVAGRRVLPYPVAAVLMAGREGRPLAVAGSKGRPRADHGGLFESWALASLDGSCRQAGASGGPLGSRLGPFVTDLRPGGPLDPLAPSDLALLLALGAWRVLGVVERAVELAVEHVSQREQFGQALSRFQTVQFALADASVWRDGLRELCHYTLWRIHTDPDASLSDALVLRVHALDAARSVLRTSQQLHGAAGMCDEYDISILCRHAQPELRLPFGVEQTAEHAFTAIGESGFEGLFPQGGPGAEGAR